MELLFFLFFSVLKLDVFFGGFIEYFHLVEGVELVEFIHNGRWMFFEGVDLLPKLLELVFDSSEVVAEDVFVDANVEDIFLGEMHLGGKKIFYLTN